VDGENPSPRVTMSCFRGSSSLLGEGARYNCRHEKQPRGQGLRSMRFRFMFAPPQWILRMPMAY